MDLKKCLQSKKFKVLLSVLGGVILALLIFQAGMFVGYRKAAFSFGYGDNYYRMFGERHHGGFMGMRSGIFDEGLTESHGVIGKIVKVELPTIVVSGRDGIEKVVLITPDTIIRRLRDTIPSTDLKAGDMIAVIGSPNTRSEVEAKYIRLLPEQMQFMTGGSTSSAAADVTAPEATSTK